MPKWCTSRGVEFDTLSEARAYSKTSTKRIIVHGDENEVKFEDGMVVSISRPDYTKHRRGGYTLTTWGTLRGMIGRRLIRSIPVRQPHHRNYVQCTAVTRHMLVYGNDEVVRDVYGFYLKTNSMAESAFIVLQYLGPAYLLKQLVEHDFAHVRVEANLLPIRTYLCNNPEVEFSICDHCIYLKTEEDMAMFELSV